MDERLYVVIETAIGLEKRICEVMRRKERNQISHKGRIALFTSAPEKRLSDRQATLRVVRACSKVGLKSKLNN